MFNIHKEQFDKVFSCVGIKNYNSFFSDFHKYDRLQ